MSKPNPDLILVLSGKRKSGKDFVCQKILDFLGSLPERFSSVVITLSAPLKEAYAEEHGLDYQRLLDSSDYKEAYRLDMINWSESKRDEDPSYFCSRAVSKALRQVDEGTGNRFSVWIVTDARRRTDLAHFKTTYSRNVVRTVRVLADESVRQQRKWVHTKGVDDCASECDLDSVRDWDFSILNNDDCQLNKCLEVVIDYLTKISKPK